MLPSLTTLCLTLLSSGIWSCPPQEPEGGRIPVLIVSGANNHDWEWTTPSLQGILQQSGKFAAEVTYEPGEFLANRQNLEKFAALVLDYNGPRWGEAAEKNFLDAVSGGTGVAVIHAANNAFSGWVEYEKMVGHLWRKGTGHGRFHRYDVEVLDRDHPITRDLPPIRRHPDELYHRLMYMHDVPFRVLASSYSAIGTGGTGNMEPMVIVKNYGQGRIFHTPLGHVWSGNENSRSSHKSPAFREIVVRGVEWAATGNVTPPLVSNKLTDLERVTGWKLLFDGNSTDHWRGYKKEEFPAQGWVVEDGALHHQSKGGGGDLITKEQYRNFDLQFEWKVAPGANSGVMYTVQEDANFTWETGPEYQVLDDQNYGGLDVKHSAGALYDMIAPQGKSLNAAGQFNHARIKIHNGHVEHWLNGVKVVDFQMANDEWMERIQKSKFAKMPGFGRYSRGHIALQDHGDAVWYRSIKILDLDQPAPREISLFNGKDLTGWSAFLKDGAGMEDVWSVDDQGVLICKGSPAGYIYTDQEYKNYVLRLEWRFNPKTKKAGNSGVLLRQIGEHKVWPKSLEAQLQSGQAGDFWMIGNFPAKGNAERTRGRNTKRTHTNENPVGKWNQYEITVHRGLCILKVNGQILNEAVEVQEVPGRIALQSEGVEIQFRNIWLRPLRN